MQTVARKLDAKLFNLRRTLGQLTDVAHGFAGTHCRQGRHSNDHTVERRWNDTSTVPEQTRVRHEGLTLLDKFTRCNVELKKSALVGAHPLRLVDRNLR